MLQLNLWVQDPSGESIKICAKTSFTELRLFVMIFLDIELSSSGFSHQLFRKSAPIAAISFISSTDPFLGFILEFSELNPKSLIHFISFAALGALDRAIHFSRA